MTKKVLFTKTFIILLVLTVTLLGCGKSSNSPEVAMENYINFVKEKNVDEAYAMLDKDNLPEREVFVESIKNEKNISSFKIIKSKEVDDNTYKFLTNLKIEDRDNELIFVLVKKDGNWLISLNTDPAKKVEF